MYMDNQIDLINTTLQRMSLLTNKFTTEELSKNPRFQKKFSELMEQLHSIQENIQLYNDELLQINTGNS